MAEIPSPMATSVFMSAPTGPDFSVAPLAGASVPWAARSSSLCIGNKRRAGLIFFGENATFDCLTPPFPPSQGCMLARQQLAANFLEPLDDLRGFLEFA
jgi:hypothetical protein